MKAWQRYEGHLASGEWHVHTSYTDGRHSVRELCREARRRGIPLIAFTEHVHRVPDYDFGQLLADVAAAREAFPGLVILSGVEARVLPGGGLDAPDEIFDRVDYPAFAFHRFPPDRTLYLESLEHAIRDGRASAWCHPGLFLRKTGMTLSERELTRVFRLMARHDVLLEVNGKYGLPEPGWTAMATALGVRTVCGNDIHGIEDFGRRELVPVQQIKKI